MCTMNGLKQDLLVHLVRVQELVVHSDDTGGVAPPCQVAEYHRDGPVFPLAAKVQSHHIGFGTVAQLGDARPDRPRGVQKVSLETCQSLIDHDGVPVSITDDDVVEHRDDPLFVPADSCFAVLLRHTQHTQRLIVLSTRLRRHLRTLTSPRHPITSAHPSSPMTFRKRLFIRRA